MSTTVTPPRERARSGSGSGTGDAWRVIVLNDDHNTFDGVAFALARTIPGLTFDGGMQLANRIHDTGRATVWRLSRGALVLLGGRLFTLRLRRGLLSRGLLRAHVSRETCRARQDVDSRCRE